MATRGIVCLQATSMACACIRARSFVGIVTNDLCMMRPIIDQGMDAITSTNAD